MLVLNAGSSSLKFSVVDRGLNRVLISGAVDFASRPARYTIEAEKAPRRSEDVVWADVADAVPQVVSDVQEAVAGHRSTAIDAVVHRVVHGGSRFVRPVRVTSDVRDELAGIAELAPLHNPVSLLTIDTALETLPDVPHVAVFDTAFHSTLLPESATYPLPAAITQRFQLRRFGFHGLSHAYCSGRAAELLQPAGIARRLAIAHLGHGASITAVRDGRSIDTTMGFTPLEGLMMGTRSGSVDPGLLLHLLNHGVSVDALDRMLNHESGLLGVSGISADMREILAAAHAGHTRAQLAVRLFAHRARQAIGALAVTLGGLDALVFTGGIGEHSAEVRAAICDGLECLGLELHPVRNASATPDAFVSSETSRVPILVVASREDLMMAREAAQCLDLPAPVSH